MHLRLTSALGTPVIEERTQELLGQLSGVLIHPDTAKIEGFFVKIRSVFGGGQLFLPSIDIRSWGLRVAIHDRDRLIPPEELIRLKPLLEDPRTILGQKIRTEAGKKLGRCSDVQLETRLLHIEWLFPRAWFRSVRPIPVSEILEVKPEAIIIKDPKPPIKEVVKEEKEQKAPILKVPEMA